MSENGKMGSSSYFLLGLGIGSAAPKSGQETRQYIADKARDANDFTRQKAREIKIRAEDAVERGKETLAQTKERIVGAIEVGRETYNREKSRAQVG